MQYSAVVTGASSGIGLAIATELSAYGYAVVGVDVMPCAHEPGCSCVHGDVRDIEVLHAADHAACALGTVVGWVNNAAHARREPLHRATPGVTRTVFDVTLEAAFWGSSIAVSRFMAQGGGGSIVNVSSIQATHPLPGWAAYVTSKGGIDALTRYIAVEYGSLGIRANAVAPGNIRTDLLDEVIKTSVDPAAMEASVAKFQPMGRTGLGSEVAALVAFLVGPTSGFVSGQVIPVDGAATVRCYPMPVDEEVLDHARRSGPRDPITPEPRTT